MSKYFKFNAVQTEFTVLRFLNDGTTGCLVKQFDTNVVVIDGTTEQISALVSQQPVEIAFTEITYDEFFVTAAKSSQAQFALSNLEEQCKDEIYEVGGYCPKPEMDSWIKQEQEARLFATDPTASTPLIDSLVISRAMSETKAELASRIIVLADVYTLKVGEILGKYQGLRKAVFAVTKDSV
jgi:hypothetical protein